MRPIKPARIVVTVMGVLAGLAVALTPGTPAAAAPGNGTLGAETVTCDTGAYQYVVTWALENYNINSGVSVSQIGGAGSLSYRVNSGDPLTPVVSSTYFIVNAAPSASTPSEAYFVQRVPGSSTSAAISMDGSWFDGTYTDFNQSKALAGTCVAPIYPKAAVRYGSGCDGTVTLTMTNNVTGAPSLTYSVSAAGGAYTRSVVVAAKQTKTLTVPAQYATGIMVKAGSYSDGPESWQQPTGCTTPTTASPTTGPTSQQAVSNSPAPRMSEDAAVAQMGGVIESGVFGNSAFGANDSSDSQRTLLAVAVLLLLVLTVIAALLGRLVFQRRRPRG